MTMEKYGVNDRVGLMKEELEEVRRKLKILRGTDEKTASIVNQIIDLQNREGSLIAAIAEQS